MWLGRRVAVVGSREFSDYNLLDRELQLNLQEGDYIISGGARGADSMAQRWAKENGFPIIIYYPDYNRFGRGAAFARNKRIVEESDIVIAFYQHGRFQEGGTANTIDWARKLGKPFVEIEEGDYFASKITSAVRDDGSPVSRG